MTLSELKPSTFLSTQEKNPLPIDDEKWILIKKVEDMMTKKLNEIRPLQLSSQSQVVASTWQVFFIFMYQCHIKIAT